MIIHLHLTQGGRCLINLNTSIKTKKIIIKVWAMGQFQCIILERKLLLMIRVRLMQQCLMTINLWWCLWCQNFLRSLKEMFAACHLHLNHRTQFTTHLLDFQVSHLGRIQYMKWQPVNWSPSMQSCHHCQHTPPPHHHHHYHHFQVVNLLQTPIFLLAGMPRNGYV